MDVEQDKERDEEIIKIMEILDIVIEQADLVSTLNADVQSRIINIDLSDEISGIMIDVFTCLRIEEKDQTGFQKYNRKIAQLNGKVINIQTIIDTIKVKGLQINFLVASPIIESITLFKGFLDEVKTGVTRFKVRGLVALKKSLKRDSSGSVVQRELTLKEAKQNIFQYGLGSHHIPLLQGITLAPERRTEVLRSLGPLTQAILLIIEDKYHIQLTNALQNSLRILPMASEIINCLKVGSPATITGILKELGDILLLTTAWSIQKIYIPILLFHYMWNNRNSDVQWSFSEELNIKFYNETTQKVSFKIKSGASSLLTSEVIFHAMFGTYVKDLSILEQITNHEEWHQRKDLNSVFMKRSEKPSINVKPISFKYIPKTAQTLVIHSNNVGRGISRPSFSGFRRRVLTQELLWYLTGKIIYGSDPRQLIYALRKVKDKLTKDNHCAKILEAGTKSWEEFKDGKWVQSTFVPVEGNKIFFF